MFGIFTSHAALTGGSLTQGMLLDTALTTTLNSDGAHIDPETAVKVVGATLLALVAGTSLATGVVATGQAYYGHQTAQAEYTQVVEMARHIREDLSAPMQHSREAVRVVHPTEFSESYNGVSDEVPAPFRIDDERAQENSYSFDATSGRLSVQFSNYRNSGKERHYEVNINGGGVTKTVDRTLGPNR